MQKRSRNPGLNQNKYEVFSLHENAEIVTLNFFLERLRVKYTVRIIIKIHDTSYIRFTICVLLQYETIWTRLRENQTWSFAVLRRAHTITQYLHSIIIIIAIAIVCTRYILDFTVRGHDTDDVNYFAVPLWYHLRLSVSKLNCWCYRHLLPI